MTLSELQSLGFKATDLPSYLNVQAPIVAYARQLWQRLRVKPRITSGWRSESANKAAGGAPQSQHLIGNALDLVFPGVDPVKVVNTALALSIPGVALQYPTGSLHIDNRTGALARWGEIVAAGAKSFNHALADVVDMFDKARAGQPPVVVSESNGKPVVVTPGSVVSNPYVWIAAILLAAGLIVVSLISK